MAKNLDDNHSYKRNYVKIAKELNYPEEVIEKLRRAKTEEEKTRIMITQRRKEKSK